MAVGHLSGDGIPDVVAVGTSAFTSGVLLGTFGGALGNMATFTTSVDSRRGILADLDFDKWPELVTTNTSKLVGAHRGKCQG